MNNLDLINTLAREKNWKELEKVFSSMTSLEHDRDGNPGCITFFKENIPEAIILGEKYNLISKLDIAFLVRYSSSTFKKDLILNLLESNTIKPKEFFNGDNMELDNSIFYQEDFLKIITQYQIDNNKEKLFDINFMKMILKNTKIKDKANFQETIFLNKANQYTDNFKFVLENSTEECSFYFFNNFCTTGNSYKINLILTYWKDNIDKFLNFNFNEQTSSGIHFLEEKYKHPFSTKLLKEYIYEILEPFNNLKLFINLQNKSFKENKIKKNKI